MIVAVDCDLRNIHATTDHGGAIEECGVENFFDALLRVADMHMRDLLLFEIAGPVIYRGSKAAAHQTNRWMIWNIFAATRLNAFAVQMNYKFLVSPSSKWTQGFKDTVRWKMSKTNAPNKHLRDAESMIWFHRQKPTDWVPLKEYMENV